MPANVSILSATHRTYSFGEFTLDIDRGALLRAGRDIKLRPKSFEVLRYLVERQGLLVSRDELLDAIWGQTIVTEDAVTQCLRDIRRALRDQSQDMIRTVPRRGYIFELPVIKGGGQVEAADTSSHAWFALAWPRWRLAEGLVLVLGIAVTWWGLADRAKKSPVVNAPRSVAVLPFEVCEDRVSDLPLAGGLTGEVHNRLAQRDYLKVMGRRSVETVAESAPSVETMTGLLGVQYLLSGTVCRDGLDLTLQAELTDHEGFVVWEQDFKQIVNRFDQVEGRLASLIDNGVAAELGDAITARSDTAVDRMALEQLHIGKEYRRQGEMEEARTAFEKALKLQPDYAEALYELAWVEADEVRTIENQADGLKQARPNIEKVLPLARAELQRDPQNFNANILVGRILHSLGNLEDALAYRVFHEIGEEEIAVRRAKALTYYAEAERHYRTALAVNPSATQVRRLLSGTMNWQGVERRKESLEILMQGMDRDPFDEELSERTAYRLDEFGRLREAMEILDRFDALPQGKSQGQYWPQLEILQNQGHIDEKLAYLIEILENDPSEMVFVHLWWTVAEIAELGLVEEAEALYAIVERIPEGDEENGGWWRQLFFVDFYLWATGQASEVTERRMKKLAGMSNEDILKAWSPEASNNAWALWHAGEAERAIELFEAMQHFPYEPSRWAQRQMAFPMGLAFMYTQVGRKEDAEPLLQKAAEQLQTDVDAGARHSATLVRLAEVYSWQGNTEAAIKMLDLAIDYGRYEIRLCCEEYWPYSREDLHVVEEWWDGLEGDPRFMQARSRMQAYVEQQRSNIRSLLAQNDMEQLLAPLMVPSRAVAGSE